VILEGCGLKLTMVVEFVTVMIVMKLMILFLLSLEEQVTNGSKHM